MQGVATIRSKVVQQVLAIFLTLSTNLAWAGRDQLPSSLLSGCWRSQTDDQVLRFEKERILVWQGGRLLVWGVEAYDREAGTIQIRVQGRLHKGPLSLHRGLLRLQTAPALREYRHDSKPPSELTLVPVTLGRATDLPSERVQSIQQELASRLEEDQTVRKDPARRGEMARLASENTRFLRNLVQEIGWLDAQRFGRKASGNAIVLLQHSMDVALVSAVLPVIEQDFKDSGPEAELFAIVYDGLRIDLGQKQRFGTQLGEDSLGQPLVLPLESVENVGKYREELGLAPLKDYLAQASKVLYDGKPIRMPLPDE